MMNTNISSLEQRLSIHRSGKQTANPARQIPVAEPSSAGPATSTELPLSNLGRMPRPWILWDLIRSNSGRSD
jgi:hypothetical protein